MGIRVLFKEGRFIVREFLLLLAAVVATFTIGRLFDAGLLAYYHGWKVMGMEYVGAVAVHDLQISFSLALMILLISFAASRLFSSPIVRAVKTWFIILLGGAYLLLIAYFGATLSPLGAEFWAYSPFEMANTIIASQQVTGVSILVFALLLITIYWFGFKIITMDFPWKKGSKKTTGITVVVLLLFVLSTVFDTGRGGKMSEKEIRANKLSYFITQSLPAYNELRNWSEESFPVQKYPLLRKASKKDVLGPYFNEFSSPPNIVFMLIESLGGEFVGPTGQWTGFTPYLDSLAREGLYWENGLSLSGRTFGFIPSLLGSLPFGEHGFMELGSDYPKHQSLISLLDKRGYYTAFYSGYDTYFDGLDFFLDYQGIDFVLNKQKLDTLLHRGKKGQNYWGVDDKKMLEFASALHDTAESFPRLEIYHTLQSHSPFNVPKPRKYERQFDRRLAALNLSENRKGLYKQYRSELRTLLFADQPVEDFMRTYGEREYFENTIFIITGDHWLIPVPQSTAISRYHVPVIIYSPKLKEPVHFKSVNTHAEITPTLTAFLNRQTNLTMPDTVHWLGGLMDTSRKFQNKQSVPFMRNKNRIANYLDGKYYLYGDLLYALKPDLVLEKKDDRAARERLLDKLKEIRRHNDYVTHNNRIYPGRSQMGGGKNWLLVEYERLFDRIDSLGLSIDQQFNRAREAAFNENYGIARAIARRILMRTPDYHDVRILIGRTYAWGEKIPKSILKKY